MSERHPHRAVSRLSLVVATVVLSLSAGASRGRAQEDAAPAPPAEVMRSEAGYSVHANQGELVRLLNEVGAEAGFTVLDSGKFQLPVTVAIDDLPLDRTLRRLLRGANFIIVYRGGKRGTEIPAEGIDQIILLTPGGPLARQPSPGSPLADPQVANPSPNAPPQAATPAARARRLQPHNGDPAGPAGIQEPPPEASMPGIALPNIPPEAMEMPGVDARPGELLVLDPTTGLPTEVGDAIPEETHQ